jgi:hypothetical protein
MLMQLPTPLLCIKQDAASAAEIGAGEQRHSLFFGRQRDRVYALIGKRAVDQDAVAGIRHIGELGDIVSAQKIVEIVLPAGRRAAIAAHAVFSIKARADRPYGRADASQAQRSQAAS